VILIPTLKQVKQHQTVKLRDPFIGVRLAVDVRIGSMAEPGQSPDLITLGQQCLGVGIEQSWRPGFSRTNLELWQLEPNDGRLLSWLTIQFP
jgi:hypothetical protein